VNLQNCSQPLGQPFVEDCYSGAFVSDNPNNIFWSAGSNLQQAIRSAKPNCENFNPQRSCFVYFSACETSDISSDIRATPEYTSTGLDTSDAHIAQLGLPPRTNTSPAPSHDSSNNPYEFLSSPDYWRAVYLEELFDAVFNRFVIAIGLALVVLLFANLIMHRRLPRALPVYGEDIQCLFKRTQRLNWRRRVVFGIVANLTMTQQQLVDTRKYRLGRVIAFDSLRRQRQNELARMHLQLAASVKSEPKDKRPLAQLWGALKTIFFFVFYLIRALFSFLFGFLFIRVTIAKLVRGTVIQSKDLVLILQAKDAIEQSTTYLKEYLTTANTFDGRDEIYEPK
jgi:hypothetical protein